LTAEVNFIQKGGSFVRCDLSNYDHGQQTTSSSNTCKCPETPKVAFLVHIWVVVVLFLFQHIPQLCCVDCMHNEDITPPVCGSLDGCLWPHLVTLYIYVSTCNSALQIAHYGGCNL